MEAFPSQFSNGFPSNSGGTTLDDALENTIQTRITPFYYKKHETYT